MCGGTDYHLWLWKVSWRWLRSCSVCCLVPHLFRHQLHNCMEHLKRLLFARFSPIEIWKRQQWHKNVVHGSYIQGWEKTREPRLDNRGKVVTYTHMTLISCTLSGNGHLWSPPFSLLWACFRVQSVYFQTNCPVRVAPGT